jgi:hypothetical protein
MKLMKIFICALGILTCCQSSAVESVLVQYEQDIDNEIVRVVGENKKTHALIVIAKKYLSHRKAAVNPKRSKYEEYEIIDTGSGHRSSLVTVPVNENLVVGRPAWVGDGYVIPVVRKSKFVEVYKYMPSTGLIEKMDTNIDIKHRDVRSVYAVSQGFILVSPSGASLLPIYYSNKSKTQHVLPFVTNKDVILSVNDVIEQDDMVYITGVGTDRVNAGNVYVWIYSFRSENHEGKGKSFVFEDKDESMLPMFIPSLHSTPSILLTQRVSVTKPPTINIINFDKKQKNVWNKSTSDLQGDKNFTVAGVCKTEFLILEKNTKREPFQQFLDFTLINNDGKEELLDMESERSKDIYLEVMAYPTNNALYTIVNYSRFEDVRRPAGWYSWFGYSIEKYNLDSICKTENRDKETASANI